jgi:hypothetical protein
MCGFSTGKIEREDFGRRRIVRQGRIGYPSARDNWLKVVNPTE